MSDIPLLAVKLSGTTPATKNKERKRKELKDLVERRKEDLAIL